MAAKNGSPPQEKNLEAFNQRQGTRLDPHDWEELRVFYLRGFLDGDQQQRFMGDVRSERRRSAAIMNLAYAENLVPRRERGETDILSLAERWRRDLASR